MFILYLDNESHLVAEVYPERAGWTLPMMLMADMVDTLRILVWQKTKDAQDGRNFPKPITRPGIVKPVARKGSQVKAQPLSEIKKIYARTEPDGDLERQRKLAAIFRG